MKLIIQNNSIIGTATDAYTGPAAFIGAPEGFDVNLMGEYVVAQGVAVLRQSLLTFSDVKSTFITQVKAEAGALTTQVLKGLESEYELAERQAIAYKAAGYPAATATVPIPGSVKSEVNSKAAKGITITATVACDNILTAATSWRNVQAAMRDNRLSVVSATEVAADADALDVIKAQWAGFVVALKLQLSE